MQYHVCYSFVLIFYSENTRCVDEFYSSVSIFKTLYQAIYFIQDTRGPERAIP